MTGQLDRIRQLEQLKDKGTNKRLDKVVAITSGKGGTGKTFVASNFAFQYARNHKVLLIDLDFNLSNLHLLFNSNPQKTLNMFFESKLIFEEIIDNYNPSLDIIYGDSGLTTQIRPSFNQINRLMDELYYYQSKYELIVLDLGAGVSEENLQILSKSKTKLIVTNPEPTALMDAYVLVKLLKSYYNDEGIYLAINRCLAKTDGSQAFQNLKSAVDHFLNSSLNFLVDIPEAMEVRQSIIDQKLLADTVNKSDVLTAINTAVSKISKIHQVFNINQSIIPSFSSNLKNSF